MATVLEEVVVEGLNVSLGVPQLDFCAAYDANNSYGGPMTPLEAANVTAQRGSLFSPQDYATVRLVLDEDGAPTGMDWGGATFPRVRDLGEG